MNKINHKINLLLSLLLSAWGILALSLFFYFYPGYGYAFLIGTNSLIYITLLFFLMGISFVPLIYFSYHFNLLLTAAGKKPLVFMPSVIKFKKRFQSHKFINIPIISIPLSLYLFAFIWIAYIFNTTHNLAIARENFFLLLIITLIVLTAFSLGRKIVLLIGYNPTTWLEKFILSEGIGFGALMVIMFLLGIFHLYFSVVAYGLLTFILVLTRKEVAELWKHLLNSTISFPTRPTLSFNGFFFVLITFLVFIYTLGIFQQYPLGFDGLISYMTYPKEYSQHHGLINFPQWIYYGFPQYGEMLFTLGFLLHGFPVALALILIFTLLVALAIHHLFVTNRWPGSSFAIFCFLSLPVVSYQNITDHKIEMIFAFYILLSYGYFIQLVNKKTKPTLIIFAILSGIAAGLKYFFFLWYGMPLALLMIFFTFKKWFAWKEVWLTAIIIAALFLPWPVRNVLFSGNPVDPILSEKFARQQHFYNAIGNQSQKYIVSEMRNEAYLIWDDQEKKDLPFFLTHLYRLTMPSEKKYFSDGINIGPIFLVFLPFFLFALWQSRKKLLVDKAFRTILFSSLLLLVGWIFIGRSIIWYGIPFLLFNSILFGIAFPKLPRLAKLAGGSLILAWFFSFLTLQTNLRLDYSTLFKQPESASDDIVRMSKFINAKTDRQLKIWGADEPRGYYIEDSHDRFIPDNYLLALAHLVKNRPDNEVVDFFHQQGIGYVLTRSYQNEFISERTVWGKLPNGSENYTRLTNENFNTFNKFRKEHLTKIYQHGDLFLYRFHD